MMKYLILVLALFSVAQAEEVFQPITLGSKDWSKETKDRMRKCIEDVEAAVRFEDPPNSKFVTQLYDGGTSEWQGDGYRLTVKHSLCFLGGVQGIAHGPIVTFDENLATSNTTTISYVRFYEIEVARKIMAQKTNHKEPNKTAEPTAMTPPPTTTVLAPLAHR